MSSQNTPCRNPLVCGVQTHRPGTIAPCMTLSAPRTPSASGYTDLMHTAVRPQTGTPTPPLRQPTVHMNAPEVEESTTFGSMIVGSIRKFFGGIKEVQEQSPIPQPSDHEKSFDHPLWDSFVPEQVEAEGGFWDAPLLYDKAWQDRQDQRAQESAEQRAARKAERTSRMEQSWDERRNAPTPEPSPEWTERYSKMEESWEKRRQERGY